MHSDADTGTMEAAQDAQTPVSEQAPRVMVIDVGGSAVKMFLSGSQEVRRFESGEHMTPEDLLAGVKENLGDWQYERVSLGYPGKVGSNGPCEDPGNLGPGWAGFDFGKAFDCPVRVVNDAVLQAIGGYAGGRMLFLGLGTGLGSALVVERTVTELELGRLPFGTDDTLFDQLGKKAFEEHGRDKWLATLHVVVERLRNALLADYVLLGGGHADEADPLPEGARRGGNEDAFAGGVLLWRDGFEDKGEWLQGGARTWRLLR